MHVLSRFVRNYQNDSVVKLRIQTITQDLVETAADLFTKYFYGEECWSKAVGIPQNPYALAEGRASFIERANSPDFSCLICCEDKREAVHKVMAVMAMELIKSTDVYDYGKAQTKEMQKLNGLYRSLHNTINPLKMLSIPCYYEDVGLAVAPEYRNLGIVKEFSKSWKMMCKLHGIPMLGALTTSTKSQKAAASDDWKTLMEIDVEDFGRLNGVVFRDVPAKMHYMISKVDL